MEGLALPWIVALGAGSTALVDLWAWLLGRVFGIATLDWALVGRWIGHLRHGRLRHRRITDASPVRAEALLGWGFHYLTGMVLAAVFLWIVGPGWRLSPTLPASLGFGIATVLLPFLILQPALGAGIASRRTPRPGAARLRSLLTHSVFGLGLYLSAWLMARLSG
ncbi:DUF2938 family protein [Pseudoxanthomonas dokdonensis]|uniref:Membrane protein n=1 Tax=Pseudoxanthomonas dokdonensis TaxID=344882 RepID=A0A0R0CFW0_9GAMM|nr:DUF2938 family protein [Pseudoxanthomonas dokdonensis]KRG68187.1 membrane protein [Pseudoxanthomonas dokdonensis]